MTSSWFAGLDAWIIQDGNYRDFRVGKQAQFALDFTVVSDIEVVPDAPVGAARVRESSYDVVGHVVHADQKTWVLDFGVLAYSSVLPVRQQELGSCLRLRIDLGVDPYDYLELLSKDPHVPDLVYTWDVVGLGMEPAPHVSSGERMARDPDTRGRRALRRTNAWKDDDGDADYLLELHVVDVPPTRARTTRTTRR